MPFDSLRDFLQKLEVQDDVLHIKDPVDLNYELSAYIKKTCDTSGPALFFENVKGSKTKVVGGVFSNRRKVMEALEARSDSDQIDRYVRGLSTPTRPMMVSSGPCKEKIALKDDLDVQQLPNPVYTRLDGGPYITLGAVISKDPSSGARNVGIYRCQIKGRRKIGIMARNSQHVMIHYQKAEVLNKPLEVAIALGLDPTIVLAAGAKLPYDTDEFDVAGGIRGAPVKLVKCETLDLEVPAFSEFVIEGKMPPRVREAEGPFGEFTGYYAGGVQNMPIIEIQAITQREDAIYQAANTGVPTTENHVIKQVSWEGATYAELKRKHPGVRAVHYPYAGGAQYVVFVSFKQSYKGEARNIIASLFSSASPPKIAVVVDDDVNVYDINNVVWALTMRFQPNEDVITFTGLPATPLDPSTGKTGFTSAIGIDATTPTDIEFPKLVEMPDLDKVPDLIRKKKD